MNDAMHYDRYLKMLRLQEKTTPTFRALSKAWGIGSNNTVARELDVLCDKGFVTYTLMPDGRRRYYAVQKDDQA